MVYILALLLLISTFIIIFERRVYRIVIYTCVYSLFASLVYLALGSPDVAMAEAAIGTYAIIFFLVVAERYYSKPTGKINAPAAPPPPPKKLGVLKIGLAFLFVGGLAALFISATPVIEANLYLRDQFVIRSIVDIGGQNIIGNILMGYRLYDTLFEALLLVIAIMAVSHLSWTDADYISSGKRSDVTADHVAFFTIRIISPILLIFGVYLILNGHISAGGGFQGGVAVACFFICRYMIYDIYDLSVKKVLKLEEIIFMALLAVSVITVFLGTAAWVYNTHHEHFQVYQSIHLIMANSLVGIKVACGFFVLFYRYITIERI